MTEKFTILNMGLNGQFIKEDGKIMEIGRVVNLLNENEQLKELIKRLKTIREEQTETILKQKRKILELEGMGDSDD